MRDRRHATTADHPRTRGVYYVSAVTRCAGPGSSPHTRGLRMPIGVAIAIIRIIPAHAGFTRTSASQTNRAWDHPRTRGVYSLLLASLLLSIGSSPHTRGLQNPLAEFKRGLRIIPAHAGFTRRNPPNRVSATDHPRTRGVYSDIEHLWPDYEGSSPHTRGLPLRILVSRIARGIIPAHAGFTEGIPGFSCEP